MLFSLVPNATYYFAVDSVDRSGNIASSGEYSFTTQPQGQGEATVTPTSTLPLPPTDTPTITPTPTVTPPATDTPPPTPTATSEPIICPTTTTPVDVVLVIDRSGSMQGQPLIDEKAAAQNFVDLMELEQDQVGLVSFSDNATLNQPLTADGNAVKNAITAIGSGGYTNMTAALTMTHAELTSERHHPAARPVMLFMSDGLPAGGDTVASARTAAQVAKDAGTRIFTIGLGSVDANLMRQLASEPGDYYFAPASTDLDAIYRTIAEVVLCGEPTIKIKPADLRVALGGGAFAVDIVAEDVAHLAAYELEIHYDPSVVQLDGVEQGPFLGSTGRSIAAVEPIVNPTEGWVKFGAFTFGTQPGVNGTGVLATITLNPQGSGATALSLQNVQVADENSNPLTLATADGQVEIIGCFGDFDSDNDVDIFDLQLVASHWNCRTGDACYEARFDTEPDGDIDAFDLQRFATAWGTTCTPTQVLRQSNLLAYSTDVSLSLHPANSQLLPNDTTTLTLRIQDAVDVGAFQTDLVFDPGIVQVENITLTDILGDTGRIVSPLGPTIDNGIGRATFGAFTLGDQAGFSGTGGLAVITLRAHGLGETNFSLQQTGVGDTQGEALPLGALNASHIQVTDHLQHYLPMLIR
ncbi:MAG: VWA domain-containing protein [Chloroflexi bacterium]|nr:VWA domain-containing protein [Chloroflexota bacterium]